MKALYVKYYSSISDKILHHRKHTLLIQFNVICLVQDISSSAWHHIPCAVLLWPVSCCPPSVSDFTPAFVSGLVSFHRELAALRWQHHHYLAATKKKNIQNTTKMRTARPTKLNHFSAFPPSSFNWRRLLRFLLLFYPASLLGRQTFVLTTTANKKKYIVYKKKKRKKKPS